MTDPDCLFCKIVSGDIDADIVKRTDKVVAFRDINPQAPMHVVIIPTRHIATVNDMADSDIGDFGQLFAAARDIASEEGIADDGYRLTMNCNQAAGQTVFHVHLHLLGKRQFGWPPG